MQTLQAKLDTTLTTLIDMFDFFSPLEPDLTAILLHCQLQMEFILFPAIDINHKFLLRELSFDTATLNHCMSKGFLSAIVSKTNKTKYAGTNTHP